MLIKALQFQAQIRKAQALVPAHKQVALLGSGRDCTACAQGGTADPCSGGRFSPSFVWHVGHSKGEAALLRGRVITLIYRRTWVHEEVACNATIKVGVRSFLEIEPSGRANAVSCCVHQTKAFPCLCVADESCRLF